MSITAPNQFIGKAVNLAGNPVEQGEKAVGNATVQLKTVSTACSRVWVGAPTANHTIGAANDGRILVGFESTTTPNQSGSIPLEVTDTAGFWFPVNDASKVWLTGFSAGDVVEYMIVR